MHTTTPAYFEKGITRLMSDSLGSENNVDNWIDKIITDLLLRTDQNTCLVDPIPIAAINCVKSITYNEHLSSLGLLKYHPDHFNIELHADLINHDEKQRFVLSHEISHTFFFDKSRVPFERTFPYRTGGFLIEYLCNRFARQLLVPDSQIEKIVNKYPLPGKPEFDMKQINHMAKLFRVDPFLFLKRIISDTGAWNCLLLRFVHIENQELNNWRLCDYYLPNYYLKTQKYFIPKQNILKPINDYKRYPGAKGKLNRLLNEAWEELQKSSKLNLIVSTDTLKAGPILGVTKSHFTETRELQIHFSRAWHVELKKYILNVCIPL